MDRRPASVSGQRGVPLSSLDFSAALSEALGGEGYPLDTPDYS